MTIYTIAKVSTEGFDGGKEVNISTFTDKETALETAYEDYTAEVDYLTEWEHIEEDCELYENEEDFRSKMLYSEYVLIQCSDFHIQTELHTTEI